jgi:protein-L-isoaspartate(D-aspartate) O-methyltransferase
MIRHYHLDATSRVLDVGCAKGYLLYELHRRGIPGVYGIDISEYGIANTPKEVRPQCFVGSAHDLSRWPDGYFDLVICKDMLHNLPPFFAYLVFG